MNILSALWILMTWCFSTRASVATGLSMHPCIFSYLWLKSYIFKKTNENLVSWVTIPSALWCLLHSSNLANEPDNKSLVPDAWSKPTKQNAQLKKQHISLWRWRYKCWHLFNFNHFYAQYVWANKNLPICKLFLDIYVVITIIWSNDGLVYWCIYASLGLKELKDTVAFPMPSWSLVDSVN